MRQGKEVLILACAFGCGTSSRGESPAESGVVAAESSVADGEGATADSSTEASNTSEPSIETGAPRGCLKDAAPGPSMRPSSCPSHTVDGGSANSGLSVCGQPVSPHDECLVDQDCGDSGVCACVVPRSAGCGGIVLMLGNVCAPAECRADADCAECGICRSESNCLGSGYYCATPNDECTSNADCSATPVGGFCAYQNGRWICLSESICPV